jgi:hypothetical protein
MFYFCLSFINYKRCYQSWNKYYSNNQIKYDFKRNPLSFLTLCFRKWFYSSFNLNLRITCGLSKYCFIKYIWENNSSFLSSWICKYSGIIYFVHIIILFKVKSCKSKWVNKSIFNNIIIKYFNVWGRCYFNFYIGIKIAC